ncbi:hypothetical protein ACA910_018415 [Epithemia clementina (nom. ined.)]
MNPTVHHSNILHQLQHGGGGTNHSLDVSKISSTHHSNQTRHSHHTIRSGTAHSFVPFTSSSLSFHASLVQDRTREQDFYDMYQVLNEIRATKLSTIYRIRKYEHKIGGSSRPKPNLAAASSPILHLLAEGSFRKSMHLHPQKHEQHHSGRSRSNSLSSSCNKGSNPNLVNLKQKFEQAFSDTRPGLSVLEVQSPPQQVEAPSTTTTASATNTDESTTLSTNNNSNNNSNLKQDAGLYFALKVINLDVVNDAQIEQLKSEIEILKVLDHKNIINAYESFQIKSHNKFMIVMELCTGGDLYSRMPYTEREVAYAMRQVVSAIDYLHSQNIIHRDIKMENIIWESNHRESAIKVIDFGLSKRFTRHDNVFTERVGSLYSMSPETMRGVYTTQADLWSIGVCAYTMLSRNKPFEGDSPKALVANILKGEFKFASPPEPTPSNSSVGGGDVSVSTTMLEEEDVWTKISDYAKNFISQLLVLEPEDRLTANTAKHHQWFYYSLPILAGGNATYDDNNAHIATAQPEPFVSTVTIIPRTATTSTTASTQHNNDTSSMGTSSLEYTSDWTERQDGVLAALTISKEFQQQVFAHIIRFASMPPFKRLALNVVAKRSTSSQVVSLRKVFDQFNTLNTGTISFGEFKAAAAMVESPCSPEKTRRVFKRVNVNRNKVINYTEFLAASLEALGPIEEFRLAEAFDLMDLDDSGLISRENLRQLLGDLARDENYIDQLFASAKVAFEDQINYQEFLAVFQGSTQNDNVPIETLDQSPQTAAAAASSADATFLCYGIDSDHEATALLGHPSGTVTLERNANWDLSTDDEATSALGGAVEALRQKIVDLREELHMAKQTLQKEFATAKRDLELTVNDFELNGESARWFGRPKENQTKEDNRELLKTEATVQGFGDAGELLSESLLGITPEELAELRISIEKAEQELQNEFNRANQKSTRADFDFDLNEEWSALNDNSPSRELIELKEELEAAKYELASSRTDFNNMNNAGQSWLDGVMESSTGTTFLDPPEGDAVAELRKQLDAAIREFDSSFYHSAAAPTSLTGTTETSVTTQFFDAFEEAGLMELRDELEAAKNDFAADMSKALCDRSQAVASWLPGSITTQASTEFFEPAEGPAGLTEAEPQGRLIAGKDSKPNQTLARLFAAEVRQLSSTEFFDPAEEDALKDLRAALLSAKEELAAAKTSKTITDHKQEWAAPLADPGTKTKATFDPIKETSMIELRAELEAVKEELAAAKTGLALDQPVAWLLGQAAGTRAGECVDLWQQTSNLLELRNDLEAAKQELATVTTAVDPNKDLMSWLDGAPRSTTTSTMFFDPMDEAAALADFRKELEAARNELAETFFDASQEGHAVERASPVCLKKRQGAIGEYGMEESANQDPVTGGIGTATPLKALARFFAAAMGTPATDIVDSGMGNTADQSKERDLATKDPPPAIKDGMGVIESDAATLLGGVSMSTSTNASEPKKDNPDSATWDEINEEVEKESSTKVARNVTPLEKSWSGRAAVFPKTGERGTFDAMRLKPTATSPIGGDDVKLGSAAISAPTAFGEQAPLEEGVEPVRAFLDEAKRRMPLEQFDVLNDLVPMKRELALVATHAEAVGLAGTCDDRRIFKLEKKDMEAVQHVDASKKELSPASHNSANESDKVPGDVNDSPGATSNKQMELRKEQKPEQQNLAIGSFSKKEVTDFSSDPPSTPFHNQVEFKEELEAAQKDFVLAGAQMDIRNQAYDRSIAIPPDVAAREELRKEPALASQDIMLGDKFAADCGQRPGLLDNPVGIALTEQLENKEDRLMDGEECSSTEIAIIQNIGVVGLPNWSEGTALCAAARKKPNWSEGTALCAAARKKTEPALSEREMPKPETHFEPAQEATMLFDDSTLVLQKAQVEIREELELTKQEFASLTNYHPTSGLLDKATSATKTELERHDEGLDAPAGVSVTTPTVESPSTASATFHAPLTKGIHHRIFSEESKRMIAAVDSAFRQNPLRRGKDLGSSLSRARPPVGGNERPDLVLNDLKQSMAISHPHASLDYSELKGIVEEPKGSQPRASAARSVSEVLSTVDGAGGPSISTVYRELRRQDLTSIGSSKAPFEEGKDKSNKKTAVQKLPSLESDSIQQAVMASLPDGILNPLANDPTTAPKVKKMPPEHSSDETSASQNVRETEDTGKVDEGSEILDKGAAETVDKDAVEEPQLLKIDLMQLASIPSQHDGVTNALFNYPRAVSKVEAEEELLPPEASDTDSKKIASPDNLETESPDDAHKKDKYNPEEEEEADAFDKAEAKSMVEEDAETRDKEELETESTNKGAAELQDEEEPETETVHT